MIRQLFIKTDDQADFRQRGKEISRIESFSDTVFGFAITLLVVTLTPIQNFRGLMNVVDGLPAFGIEFAMLVAIWLLQFRFFRRYNLQDRYTIALNMLLLFVVLFYVYPLRFMFSVVAFNINATLIKDGTITDAQIPQLFIIYGIGYTAVFVLFTLMHIHAYGQREALGLNELEIFDTQTGIIRNIALAGVGVLSILIAISQVGASVGLAGWVYASLFVIHSVIGQIRGRQRRVIQHQLQQNGAPVPSSALSE